MGFYFDKFELYIEDDNGEYKLIKIENSSFENKIVNGVMPNWNQGVSKGEAYSVKEFSFNSSEDNVDGNYSLLIEGRGIISIERNTSYLNGIGTLKARFKGACWRSICTGDLI